MKLIQLLFILSFFVILGCRKNRNHTLEGRIMLDCETPLAYANLELREHYYDEKLIKEFKTDENGYFNVSYSQIDDHQVFGSNYMHSEIEIISAASDSINVSYYYIPGNRSFDFNTMPILRVRKDYDIYLEVNNPYTDEDTLHIYDYTKENPAANPLEIQGPFQSGLLYSVENGIVRSGFSDFSKLSLSSSGIDFLNELEVKPMYSCNIKGPDTYQPSNVSTNFGLQCEEGNYEVTLVID